MISNDFGDGEQGDGYGDGGELGEDPPPATGNGFGGGESFYGDGGGYGDSFGRKGDGGGNWDTTVSLFNPRHDDFRAMLAYTVLLQSSA